MQRQRILIIGAGIAGAAAAALLGRRGHEVTLVERSTGARSSGSPVDIRGDGLDTIRALGLEAASRAKDTGAHTLALVDRAGRAFTTLKMKRAADDIEIPRVALAGILADAAREHATVRFDETPVSLAPDEGGVDVVFRSGARERFDLVIAADGQHSSTRGALWDGASVTAASLSLAIATIPLPGLAVDSGVIRMHNEPGLSLTVHPAGGTPGVAFIFRTAEAPRDRDAQIALVRERYAGMGWRAPEFLAALEGADDLYYDTVRAVDCDTWVRGRVVLLGDAAASVTILGEGSSAALAGARTLERALASAPDLRTALARYEREHRPLVDRGRRGASAGAAFLVPRTAVGLAVRDLLSRMMRTA